PQRDRGSRGHVLAEVVAGPFDHGHRARIADAEAFADAAGDEKPPAGGAVEAGVSGENGVGGRVLLEGPYDHLAAAHALADVVVGFAHKRELDVRVQPGREALAGAAGIVTASAGAEVGSDRAQGIFDGTGCGRPHGGFAVAVPGPPAAW